MRFTLVRHGEVEEPASLRMLTGHYDPQLTQHGRRQSAALANELFDALERGESYQGISSSPLRAARLTAEALAAVLDIDEPAVAPELMTLTPEVLPPDGDLGALEAIQARAWDWLETQKQAAEPGANLLLVTHDLTIRAVVCRALSLPLNEMHRFQIDPASLTTIEFRLQNQRERVLIARLNETCHLDQSIAP